MRKAHQVIVLRPSGWIGYVYAWRGGPNIHTTAPQTTRDAALAALTGAAPEIAARWGEVVSGAPRGTAAAVCRAWRSSPEFAVLAPATKKTYHRHLDRIEYVLGHLTVRQFAGDVGADAAAALRDSIAERSLREADAAMVTLGALCTWARHRSRRLVPSDCAPASGLHGLYVAPIKHPPPRALIDEAIAKMRPTIAHAVAFALHSGLRRTDLTRAAWSWEDPELGALVAPTSKGKRKRRVAVIEITPGLRAVLDRIPKRAATILTNERGRPWKPDSLGQALDRELARVGMAGAFTLHRLRARAATARLAEGVSTRSVARSFGWSEHEAERLAPIYAPDADVLRVANDAAASKKKAGRSARRKATKGTKE